MTEPTETEQAPADPVAAFVGELESIEAELSAIVGADELEAFKVLAAERFGEFLESLMIETGGEIANALREIIDRRMGPAVH